MRAHSRPPNKRGPQPRPRRRVNPALRYTVYGSGRPVWQLAAETGFRYQTQFSALINAALIPSTRVNIERLYRIADAVGFDRAHLFLTGGGQ